LIQTAVAELIQSQKISTACFQNTGATNQTLNQLLLTKFVWTKLLKQMIKHRLTYIRRRANSKYWTKCFSETWLILALNVNFSVTSRIPLVNCVNSVYLRLINESDPSIKDAYHLPITEQTSQSVTERLDLSSKCWI